MGSGDQPVENTTRGTSRAAVESPVDDDDELAKRIEAEINSARAFAEHAYYGKAEIETNEEPVSPGYAAS
eukprot:scaffold35419_cov58-Skeletonema_marinoi.AAC.1